MKNKKFLVSNPGSASKKYSFYNGDELLLKAHFEIENGGFVATWTLGVQVEKDGEKKIWMSDVQKEDYENSVEVVLGKIIELGFIKDKGEIDTVGVRIVAPGSYFLKPRVIDEEFLKNLKETESKAPLHIPSEIAEIEKINEVLPDTKKFGVSDSTFFADRRKESRYYGLPMADAEKFEVFRFGYHGISALSVVRKLEEDFKVKPSRLVICHLGSGASVIAVKDGKGFDSSMGFTPLEGLVMATRSGDIDVGAVTFLMKKFNFSPDQLDEYLNNKCGLLGLSGKTDDMREIIRLKDNGDEDAKIAFDVFAYRVKKYIGSYMAVMGGLDAIIFTGTMGERSNIVRAKVLGGMSELGIELDGTKNDATIGKDGNIEVGDSKVKIFVIKTDEMREIFEEIKTFRNF